MQKWHVHHGYLHSENSEKLHDPLIADDKKLLEKVKKIWHNRGRFKSGRILVIRGLRSNRRYLP